MDTQFVVAPTMRKQFFDGLEIYIPEDIQSVITSETNESLRKKIAVQEKLANDYINKYATTLDNYQYIASEFDPERYDALSTIDRRRKTLDKFNNNLNDPNNYPNYLGRRAYDLIHEKIQPYVDKQYDKLKKDQDIAYLTSLGQTRKYGEEAFLTNKLDFFINRPNIDEQKAVLQQNLMNLDYRLQDLNSLAKSTAEYEPLDIYKPKQESVANEIKEEQDKIKDMKHLMQTKLNYIEQPGYGEGCVIV